MARNGLKIPEYVYDRVFTDGSVMLMPYDTLLYDFLRNKVSFITKPRQAHSLYLFSTVPWHSQHSTCQRAGLHLLLRKPNPNLCMPNKPISMFFAQVITYQQHVPWAEEYDSAVGFFRDMGFMDKFIYETIPIEAVQFWTPPKTESSQPLGFAHIELSLMASIILTVASIVLFFLEMILGWVRKKREAKRMQREH